MELAFKPLQSLQSAKERNLGSVIYYMIYYVCSTYNIYIISFLAVAFILYGVKSQGPQKRSIIYLTSSTAHVAI